MTCGGWRCDWAIALTWRLLSRLAGLPKAFQLLNDPDAAAGGDYKFAPLGFGGGATGDLAEKELANGRAAILGFSGIVTQSALTGNGFPCAPGTRMRHAHATRDAPSCARACTPS